MWDHKPYIACGNWLKQMMLGLLEATHVIGSIPHMALDIYVLP